MALRIDDYFDEDERPAEERDDEAQPAQQEAQAAPAVPEEEQYREDFIVTNGQRRRRRWRRIIIAGTLLVVAAIVVNMLFVSKKVDKGCVRGYLVKVELSSGLLFDSYECTMVTDYPDRVTDANDLIFIFRARPETWRENLQSHARRQRAACRLRALFNENAVARQHRRVCRQCHGDEVARAPQSRTGGSRQGDIRRQARHHKTWIRHKNKIIKDGCSFSRSRLRKGV